jgi:hypothetical protein
MSTLHARLQEIAQEFVASVLGMLKSLPLDKLLVEAGVDKRRPAAGAPSRPAAAVPARIRSPGRLPRRSPEEIGQTLEQVVGLIKKNPEGMRAEQIRRALGLQAKEMPRILKEGLGKRQLRTRGQKRATTYFIK